MQFDPDKAFLELENAAEEMVESGYQAMLLEELKPVVLAEIMRKQGDVSVAKAELLAKSHAEYRTHLQGMCEARRRANKAHAHYRNLQALWDGRRTQEVSTRQLIR